MSFLSPPQEAMNIFSIVLLQLFPVMSQSIILTVENLPSPKTFVTSWPDKFDIVDVILQREAGIQLENCRKIG